MTAPQRMTLDQWWGEELFLFENVPVRLCRDCGEGRREYELKRRHVLKTLTNLVEIDLLRAGEPMEMSPRPQSDYRILVREGWHPARGQLFSFSVQQPIPDFQVPLREGESRPTVHLGRLLHETYERARYDLRLDYRLAANPPLSGEVDTWAQVLLQSKGLRET